MHLVGAMSSVIINTGPKVSQGTVITMGGSHHLLPAHIYTTQSNGHPMGIPAYSGPSGKTSGDNTPVNGNEGKPVILQSNIAGNNEPEPQRY
jgi:hypothetical protein